MTPDDAVDATSASDHRQPAAVGEDRRAVPTDPGECATAQEELAGAPEDDVEGDRVAGEQDPDGDDAHHRP